MKLQSDNDTTTAPAAASEPRNVAVDVLENRTLIRGMLVAAGRCDFPLTKTEAETLEGLKKVHIVGEF